MRLLSINLIIRKTQSIRWPGDEDENIPLASTPNELIFPIEKTISNPKEWQEK